MRLRQTRGGIVLTQTNITEQNTVISKSAVESVDAIRQRFQNEQPMAESEGGMKVNPTIDTTEKGDLAKMMSDYEETDEATYDQRIEQHEDLERSLREEESTTQGQHLTQGHQQQMDQKQMDLDDVVTSETDKVVDQAIEEMNAEQSIPAGMPPQERLLPNQRGEVELEEEEDEGDEFEQDRDYVVHKIVSRSNPESHIQRKVFVGVSEDNTMTRKGILSCEVEWQGCPGMNTLEPFNRLKEDVPKMAAEYIRRELGDKPMQYQNRALRNAVRWTNDYLTTENEELRTYIQRIAVSGYYRY
jgi:hypothetical protein